MSRFFFDLQDGRLIEDTVGLDLADDEAAQDYAIGLAETVLRTRAESGHTSPWHVIIKDANGQMLGTVTSISA